MKEMQKTEKGVLSYVFDWAPFTNNRDGAKTDWLASGETITEKTITVPTGITLDSSSLTDSNTSVTVILSGGTLGETYDIECFITTSAGNKDARIIRLSIIEG